MDMQSGAGGMGDVTPDDKLWAALAYVFTPLVPIIILLLEDKKKRPFIQAHNVQALVFGIAWNVIVVPILGTVTLGCGFILVLFPLYYGYQAYQGKQITIPVITNFVKNQGWV